MKSAICILAMSMALISGCATIVGDKTQRVPISSDPGDARVRITDEQGIRVFEGLTPTSVTLDKSDGSYWGKKRYTVEITKAGYETQVIPITASPNGWYIAGNLVFGGLIGWFIVDPMNGAMYTLSPESIASTLRGAAAHNNGATDGSISIVLLEDVPAALRGRMTRLNGAPGKASTGH